MSLDGQQAVLSAIAALSKKVDDQSALTKKLADQFAALSKKVDDQSAKLDDQSALTKKLDDQFAALSKKVDDQSAIMGICCGRLVRKEAACLFGPGFSKPFLARSLCDAIALIVDRETSHTHETIQRLAKDMLPNLKV
jgi:uncharacterized coiled-coil protein SlyX